MIGRKRSQKLWSPTVASTGWSDVQIEQFRSVLRPAGFQVDFGEGRLVVSRARGGAA